MSLIAAVHFHTMVSCLLLHLGFTISFCLSIWLFINICPLSADIGFWLLSSFVNATHLVLLNSIIEVIFAIIYVVLLVAYVVSIQYIDHHKLI